MNHIVSDGNDVVEQQFQARLDNALSSLEIGAPDDDSLPPQDDSIFNLRRRRRATAHDPIRVASLVEIDGVLTWQTGLQSRGPTRRRGFLRRPPPDRVIRLVRFEELEPSQITALLDRLDDNLTPRDNGTGERGLRRWRGNQLTTVNHAPAEGNMLLIVHGTFSNSHNVFNALNATPAGRSFLQQAQKQYSAGVFAFDHSTLSTSPIENAIDLSRVFQGSRAKVDTIAHSRGGVVVRWWYEVLSPADPELRHKAVFVGSPMAGTSLAAPPKWRSLMDYLTNLANVIGESAGAIGFANPCLMVGAAMLKIFGSAASIAAHTPLADAAVALVPGLSGQSRVGNQPGLRRLRLGNSTAHERYFIIQSNFEPDAVGWRFWRVLNRPLDRLTNLAADALFSGPNDLVVDVDSMGDIRDDLKIPIDRSLDFGTNSLVHHTNYFAQSRTLDHLARWLFAEPP